MPDWIAHILVTWTACTVLGFRYKAFNTENTVIAMIGSIIPDIYKLYIPLSFLGYDFESFLFPIHTPFGSLILAVILSMFFKESKTIFMFFIFGIITHFALDSLLQYPSSGIYLFFPLSWNSWQIGVIPIDDYNTTILTVVIAISVYIISLYNKKSISTN